MQKCDIVTVLVSIRGNIMSFEALCYCICEVATAVSETVNSTGRRWFP